MAQLPGLKTRLFLTVWVVFAAHAATNIVREHYPAFALVKSGTFRVDEYQGLHSDIFVHSDGHSYVGNNVAPSVIAAVPLWLFSPALDALEAHEKGRVGSSGPAVYRVDKPLRQQFYRDVSERGLTMRFGASALVTTVFLVAPLSALCAVGLFRVLVERRVTRGRALGLSLVFALGTPLFFRSAGLTNNVFVMYFTFASFLLLWQRRGEAPPVSLPRRLLAGFCAGMALACDYSGIIPLGCLYLYAVLGRWRTSTLVQSIRESVPFILGSVPPVGFLMYSQWVMFGDPFRPGQYWMPAVNYTEQGWRGFSTPSFETFLLNLLHPSYGLFLFGPLLILAFWPARNAAVLPRAERWFVAGLVGLFLLFCAANQYSRMQFNTGFRYLLPLVPFLYLAACDHLARWPRWAVWTAALPAVAHTWIMCMARDCNPNGDTWRFAPDFAGWWASVAAETVPASYLRVWNDGLQLPWLRVLQLTAPPDHPVLAQAWLPSAVIALAGLLVAAVWLVRRSPVEPATKLVTPPGPPPTVAVVVPVLNEAHVLEGSIRTLRTFLQERFPYPAHIVIADNGSKDGTGEVARRLTEEFDDVRLVSLTARGRGRALRAAWTQSRADIVAYMDVDLSTGLEALEPLCRGIHEEGYDLGTGSRLLPGSVVTRCFKREVLSRGYNLLIKCVLFTKFSDAQCGFKVASRRVINEVIPLVKDQHWFFDTELLVLGEKMGYRIKDVPVRWVEDPDSRVKIASTVWEDIKGVFRLRRLLWSGTLRRPEPVAAQPRPVAVPVGQVAG